MNQIIYDMPADFYHKSEGVSNSDLKKFDKSGEHYKEAKENPSPSTPSCLFGSAYHKAIFEWPDFEANAVVMPEFSGKGSVAAREEWKSQQAGKITLTEDDYKTILAMRAKIMQHETAPSMIVSGKAEVSAFYQDEEFGLLRKCRADFLPNNCSAIVDLKTAEDAGEDKFSKTIYDFGYYQQGAYYLDIFNALCPDEQRNAFCFIAQEKKPPYAIGCYYLNAEAIELGRIKYRKLLSKFARCKQSNRWPGYGDNKLVPIGVPSWGKKREETGVDVLYTLDQ